MSVPVVPFLGTDVIASALELFTEMTITKYKETAKRRIKEADGAMWTQTTPSAMI